MNYTLIFLPEADKDYDDIQLYLEQYYENTAVNFFKQLKKRIESLKTNPNIAPSYDKRPSYRKLIVEKYIVFYKVDEEKKRIEIHRILHGSRDIRRYI